MKMLGAGTGRYPGVAAIGEVRLWIINIHELAPLCIEHLEETAERIKSCYVENVQENLPEEKIADKGSVDTRNKRAAHLTRECGGTGFRNS